LARIRPLPPSGCERDPDPDQEKHSNRPAIAADNPRRRPGGRGCNQAAEEEVLVKSISLILGAAALVMGAGVANAGSNWIGVSGGAGIPTGNYSNAASTGWHLGVTGTHMINKQWGVGGDLGYHAWGGSSDANAAAVTAFGPGSEFKWSALQATAHGVMAFPTQSEMKPYATVGIGLYDVTAQLKSPTGNNKTTKSELGYNVGAGMDLGSRHNMKWGIVGSYHIIPANSDFGSNLDFFSLGVSTLWGSGN
jgi:hypothetical protein